MSAVVDWSAKFWREVHPEALSGCWLWHGRLQPSGYGQTRLLGRQQNASRVAWTLLFGEPGPGLCVCHRCDVGVSESTLSARLAAGWPSARVLSREKETARG